MRNKTVTITPDMALYPDAVRQRLAAAPSLTVQGQWPLPDAPVLALLSSAKAPAGILLAVHDLTQQWRQTSQPIISGFHSPVEQEALTILLREPGRVVLCPARSLPQRLPAAWREALAVGQLTLLSPFPATVQRASKATAITRNRFVAALADVVLIAYAHPGSSTEALAQEVLGWGKPIYTLDHPANHHWQQMGVPVFTNKITQP